MPRRVGVLAQRKLATLSGLRLAQQRCPVHGRDRQSRQGKRNLSAWYGKDLREEVVVPTCHAAPHGNAGDRAGRR
jgi:hypothetical protein